MFHNQGSSSLETEAPSSSAQWHRPQPPVSDGRAPVLFWLSVLTLGGIALGFVTWTASALLAQNGSEKLLRVERFLPKLKNSHGERKAVAFRTSEPEISEQAPPKDRKAPQPASLPPLVVDLPKVKMIEAPGISEPAPPRVAPLELGPPPLAAIEPPPMVTCTDPVVYLKPCTPERGDTPMIRNWKSLAMISLLSAASVTLAPPPMVFAQDDKIVEAVKAEIKKLENGALSELDKKIKSVGTDVQEINKKIGTLQLDVSTLQGHYLNHKIELEKQRKDLELLSAEVHSLKKRLLADAGPSGADRAAFDEMIKTMKAIQESLAKLGPTEKRVMMSPPTNGSSLTSGKVMLVNLYTEDLLFLVNGAPFRVPAGRSRLVENVPIGNVQYLVHSARWGTLENRSTTLGPGDTFTLTAAR